MRIHIRQSIKHYFIRLISGILVCLCVTWHVPYLWCSRHANRYFENDLETQLRLQRGVEKWLARDLNTDDYTADSSLFQGEWLFGTYLTAGLGFGQMAWLHPELREHNTLLMEQCIERILSEEVRAFDKLLWRQDPIEALKQPDSGDHAAYLGYFNMLLSLHRTLKPESEYARLNDDITAHLVQRLRQSSIFTLRTYPQERYPVDNCAVLGSIGLYDKATGADHSDLLDQALDYYRANYVDSSTGLLIQAVGAQGEAFDDPRGSGTALGLYFLALGNLDLGKPLYRALRTELAGTVFRFGAVREYPRGTKNQMMDVDAGPIIFGFGFSATGFAVAGTRIYDDPEYFKHLYATANFAGAPWTDDDETVFITGGPLGTSILFAMFTALPEGYMEDLKQ